MRNLALIIALLFTFIAAPALADTAGENIEEAAQETGEAMENAAEETGEAMDNAADEVEEAVDGDEEEKGCSMAGTEMGGTIAGALLIGLVAARRRD